MSNEDKNVPTALQEQLDQVKQNIQQQSAAEEPAQPAAPVESPEAPAVVTTPAQQTQASQLLGNTPKADSQSQQGSDDWKHKYDVLNGMFRKETSELRERTQQLEAELEKARQSGESAQITADSISDEEVQSSVSQDMIDEFGIDYWKQQIAISRSVATSAKSEDPRLQQVEQQLERQNRQAFYGQLTAAIPNWEQVNEQPEWNAFLEQREPLTGASYEALLMDAYQNFDASRTAQLFQTFLSKNPGSSSGFDQLATPSPKVPATTVQGQTMSFDDWKNQMQELSSGGFSPMEVVQKQNELMSAWKEGRVIGAPDGMSQP